MSNKKIITSFQMLNEEHTKEIKDFMVAAFEKWQPIAAQEAELIVMYGKLEHAPLDAAKDVANRREEYLKEWGSEGTLLTNILEQQKIDRLELSKTLQKVREARLKDQDRER